MHLEKKETGKPDNGLRINEIQVWWSGPAANVELAVRCCKSRVPVLEFGNVEGELMTSQNIAFPGEPLSAEANPSKVSCLYPKLDYAKQSSIGVNLDIEERNLAEIYLAGAQRLAHIGSWAFNAIRTWITGERR